MLNKPVRCLATGAVVLLAVLSAGMALAQDASGIKAANLIDADLDLMNNHDPMSELENFELLDGYQVNLFAADPMLANPVHMHWDSRGRLWVACSWAYPQLKPGETANDKIIILEDTDGDGMADKSTVFADGLYIPTGLELANGGCYVAQSPDVFFLKDTDGDDVADVKELALTGFGIEDSHHSISAWRRGPGGWLYFQEGIFLHTQVETQHGVVRNFNGGVYQYHPRTQELRMFCRGTGGNPWGHVFDQWGQSFMVNNPRIMYLSPATGNSGDIIQIKPLISTEKQCGGDLATGTHVGDDIRGQLLSGRFKSRAIIRYELIEDGAGFSANVLPPLMTSKHPNFRPVDVKTGPDGAIYIADWYNSIINHAQHDFRDPRRDHEHGRIWRITHKDRPLVAKPKLVGVAIEQLVEQLGSPEAWTRHQVRLELSERDADAVLAATEQWVDSLDPSLPGYDHHLVEAMWACQNVQRPSEKILSLVLGARDGNARSAGARVLRYWHPQLSDPIGMLARACDDSFPRTRMEAVLSAGFMPEAEAYAAALHCLDHGTDPLVDEALTQTRKALEPFWRPALEAGQLQFAKASHQAFAVREAGLGFPQRLSEFLLQSNPSQQEIASVCEQLRMIGTDDDLLAVVKAVASKDGVRSTDAKIALLETLEKMQARKASPALQRSLQGLKEILNSENDTIAILAATNIGVWKVTNAGSFLAEVIQDSSRPVEVRRAGAIAMARLRSTATAQMLAEIYEAGDCETRYVALVGLVYTDLDKGVQKAAQLLTEDPADSDPAPLIQAIVNLQQGSTALGDSLRDVTIHPTVKLRVSELQRSSGFLPPELAELFRASSAAESLSERLLSEDRGHLTRDVELLGDAERGESIYRRKSLACTSCHAIGPVGAVIGPNLVAVGAAAKTSYIVQSLLEPNAAIAEHYENRMFVLDDGTIQTGIITFKSDAEVVVRDAAQAGKEVRLSVDEILAERVTISAMPAGLVDQLHDRQEFLDLAKFVSLLGKPGPYANDESPVIRKWQLVAAAGDALPAEEAAWTTVYSRVNGTLPREDFPIAEQVFARGYVNVQVAGKAQLKINELAGLRIWIDGREMEDPAAIVDLSKGRRVITTALDFANRGDKGLRLEFITKAGLTAKLQPEGGL